MSTVNVLKLRNSSCRLLPSPRLYTFTLLQPVIHQRLICQCLSDNKDSPAPEAHKHNMPMKVGGGAQRKRRKGQLGLLIWEGVVEHRSPDSHKCTKVEEAKDKDDIYISSSVKLYLCSVECCQNKETVTIACELCNRQVCINHRFPENHNCPVSQPSSTTKKAPIKIELKNEKYSHPVNKPFGRKSKKTSAILNLMMLKKDAVGQSSLPLTERCYFSLILPSSPENDTLSKIFFSNKLIFYNEKNHILDSNKVLQEVLDSGLIENGQTLRLEYVSPGT
ncbi:AN1-type zinc finger protein 1 [Nymphon striatum]|nr:AN1-type zinc finger protein 1 [Nymphon striatum]